MTYYRLHDLFSVVSSEIYLWYVFLIATLYPVCVGWGVGVGVGGWGGGEGCVCVGGGGGGGGGVGHIWRDGLGI